jgi:hypothetical protein
MTSSKVTVISNNATRIVTINRPKVRKACPSAYTEA